MEIGQDPSSFGSQVGVASKIRQGQTAAIPPVGSADRSRKVETTIVEGQVLFAHQHQQRVAQAELRDNVIAGHARVDRVARRVTGSIAGDPGGERREVVGVERSNTSRWHRPGDSKRWAQFILAQEQAGYPSVLHRRAHLVGHVADVLPDDGHAESPGGFHHHVPLLIGRIAHVRAVAVRRRIRHPEQAVQPHDVVDAQQAAVTHLRLEACPQIRMVGRDRGDRMDRPQSPVLTLREEAVWRSADAHVGREPLGVFPDVETRRTHPDRQVEIQANPDLVEVLVHLSELRLHRPLAEDLEANVRRLETDRGDVAPLAHDAIDHLWPLARVPAVQPCRRFESRPDLDATVKRHPLVDRRLRLGGRGHRGQRLAGLRPGVQRVGQIPFRGPPRLDGGQTQSPRHPCRVDPALVEPAPGQWGIRAGLVGTGRTQRQGRHHIAAEFGDDDAEFLERAQVAETVIRRVGHPQGGQRDEHAPPAVAGPLGAASNLDRLRPCADRPCARGFRGRQRGLDRGARRRGCLALPPRSVDVADLDQIAHRINRSVGRVHGSSVNS